MNKSVGLLIRKRREEYGLTLDRLGELAGLSKSFLSELENGKRDISFKNISALAGILKLSLDDLSNANPAMIQRTNSDLIEKICQQQTEMDGLKRMAETRRDQVEQLRKELFALQAKKSST